MGKQRIESTEPQLHKVRKKCEIIYTFFKVAFALNIFVWFVVVSLCIVAIFDPVNRGNITADHWITLISYFIVGIIFAVILWLAVLIFRDITRKALPFSGSQIRRMRLIALLLLMFSLIDYALASAFFNPEVLLNISLGYSTAKGLSEPMVAAYVGAAISAIVVYGLSVVFEYGRQLQNRSDEII